MAIAWESIQQRRDELEQILANAHVDRAERQRLQKELARVTGILDKKKSLDEFSGKENEFKQLISEATDQEWKQLLQDELAAVSEKAAHAQQLLTDTLFPPNEHDSRSVYLEVRAGTGGQEAALFAADLLKMYSLYAQRMGWRANVDHLSNTDLGGIREGVLHIQGDGVYGHLKHESGVHRVQRVPATETAGRIHTSTATVVVLPEAQEVDVSINPADLRIDVYRSSGAGGQHVNTTDSAVRITHIPTGVVVACQDERSQHKNKAKAMKMLQSRILAAELEKQQAQMSQQRREQVGTGGRSEKVRTYNFPQNRVTDHQVNVTLKKLDMVMEGDLDDIIQELRAAEQQRRMEQPLLV
jgi:peptide chain release factor 1